MRDDGPAPGFRDAGNNERLGGLLDVGYNGYSWSSAVSGPSGVFLNFHTQLLDPRNPSDRANGRQLRCLSE